MSTWYLRTIIGLKRFTVTTLISSHRMLASHTAPLLCGFMNLMPHPHIIPLLLSMIKTSVVKQQKQKWVSVKAGL